MIGNSRECGFGMFEMKLFDIDTLSEKEDFEIAFTRMPKNRQEKILRQKFQQDQKLSLGAGILMEQWLYSKGILYNDVKLKIGEHGKAEFVDFKDMYFNLSHSGKFVVLATATSPIGVDIERIRGNCLRIANRFFTQEEINLMNLENTTEQKEDFFFRLWTMKESYMKAKGMGFKLGFKNFSIKVSANTKDSVFYYPKEANDYALCEIQAPSGYKLSVCYKK